jgi:3-methyl-2-oxobutanoate hydroxymethyltransferase
VLLFFWDVPWRRKSSLPPKTWTAGKKDTMSTSSERFGAAGASSSKKTTVLTLREKYRRSEPIVMLTAYDYMTARVLDAAGIDAILVGDSLAMVVLGLPDTLSVTMEEMLHHARAVSRGAHRALLIGDMPFLSYQADRAEAVRNAGRFLKEGGMNAVKLEGGRNLAPTARSIVEAGIPVLGHIGLTPQSTNVIGGFLVQGRTAEAGRALLEDALALEEAGCFAVVIESVPERLATFITTRLSVPTIGIGAGGGVSGQVLVTHDLLGFYDRLSPKFARRYAEVHQVMRAAVEEYRRDVEAHDFPSQEHVYSMPEEEWQAFIESVRGNPRMTALPGKPG